MPLQMSRLLVLLLLMVGSNPISFVPPAAYSANINPLQTVGNHPQSSVPNTPTQSTPQHNTRGWIETSPDFNVRTSPEAQLRPYNKDALQVFSGDVLVVAKRTGLVLTPLAVTYVKQDSTVLFRVNSGIERIMVLNSPGLRSVVTVASNRAARLGPGNEVVVTDHRPRVRETRQSDEIGRRSFKAFDVGKELFMTTTEFSIWHLLIKDPLLHGKDALSESVRTQALKTASIIEMVMAKHGPYVVEPLDDLFDYEPL